MSLKGWHSLVTTVAAVLFGVIFFVDAWDWLFSLLAVWLTVSFASNLVFARLNRARLSDKKLWNVSEYRNHQDFSLAAAREVWDDEKPGSTLELRVKLRGRIEAEDWPKAPLSSQKAAAWRVTADGFKHTRLGAEGDFTPLFDKTWVPGLTLEDAGDRAAIEPPARLNAGCFREELVTWDGLNKFNGIKDLVQESITLQGLKHDQFTGFRLTETRLEAEPVTVFGTLSRRGGLTPTLTLTGTDIPDDPASLLIVADRAKDKKRLQLRRSPVYWVNVALLVLSLPLSYIAVAGSPLIPRYYGAVKITPGGQELQIDLGVDSPHVWTFDTHDTRTLVSLLYRDKDYEAAASEPLTVSVFGGSVSEYGPGREGRLRWDSGHWLLNTSHPAALNREGLFRYRNLTSKSVILRFPSNSEISTYWWTLKPHAGQGTDGNYLTLNGKDLHIPEGTEASLKAGKNQRLLVAGVSAELAWNGPLDSWVLTLTDPVLTAGSAPLWAVPHPSLHLRGVVTDAPDGQTDTFDVPPDPSGQPVLVKSIAGEPYRMVDTQVFSLRQTEKKVLYQGPLKGYSGSRWIRDHWEIVVPLTPAP